MSLLVIDFTLLEGEMVNSWSRSSRLSMRTVTGFYHMSLWERTAWKKYERLTPELIRLLTMAVIGTMVIYYIQRWKLFSSRSLICHCNLLFEPQKTQFTSGLMDRIVIAITQLGCPPLADISLQGISCTFACHKFRHVCALRTACSLAQWLNFHILNLHYAKCSTQPACHWCFPDYKVTSSYIYFQLAGDKVRLRLPEREPQTTGEDWDFFRPCGVEWPTVVHSGDVQE